MVSPVERTSVPIVGFDIETSTAFAISAVILPSGDARHRDRRQIGRLYGHFCPVI